MAKASTATHLAKDGKLYESYEEMRKANIRFNEARLRAKGLDAKSIRALAMPKTAIVAVSTKRRVVTPDQVRRSNRVKKQPPTHNGIDEVYEDYSQYRTKKRRKVQPSNRALSEQDRQKLMHLPEWIDDLEEYLVNEERLSEQNYRTVMRQVKKLAAGIGITYANWGQNVVFYPNKPVNLSFDFNAMFAEAQDFEDEHGRDLGNGWLLRHPIKKLENFQRYYFEKNLPKK